MFRFNHLLEPRQSNYHKIQVVRQVQLKNNYIDVSFSNVYLLISLIAIINHFFAIIHHLIILQPLILVLARNILKRHKNALLI
jgi:hypothetical protein